MWEASSARLEMEARLGALPLQFLPNRAAQRERAAFPNMAA